MADGDILIVSGIYLSSHLFIMFVTIEGMWCLLFGGFKLMWLVILCLFVIYCITRQRISRYKAFWFSFFFFFFHLFFPLFSCYHKSRWSGFLFSSTYFSYFFFTAYISNKVILYLLQGLFIDSFFSLFLHSIPLKEVLRLKFCMYWIV